MVPFASVLGGEILVVSIEQFVGHLTSGSLVGEIKGVGAKPLHANNRDEAVRQDSAYHCTGLKVFESNHSGPSKLKNPLSSGDTGFRKSVHGNLIKALKEGG